MQTAKRLWVILLCFSLVAYAQGNTFTKVRYNGGTLPTKTDKDDWNNTLTVTSDLITFKLKDTQTIEIVPISVTSLSYGQEAHRRVGTMVALAILVAPVALFGLFHKTRLHYIGIQYDTQDGKKAGLLIQGDKGNYRAIITALQGVTGAPVAVSEKEREFIPVGIATSVTQESTSTNQTASKASETTNQPAGAVAVSSIPEGADVQVDGAFVGNAPASLKLVPGKHTIRVVVSGYKEWSREVTVMPGSEVKLTATLKKQD